MPAGKNKFWQGARRSMVRKRGARTAKSANFRMNRIFLSGIEASSDERNANKAVRAPV
jgi:hypothetical protein